MPAIISAQRPFLDASDPVYGVDMSGATNATTALQALYSIAGPKTVWLPPGSTPSLAGSVTVPDRTHTIGSGATVSYTNTSSSTPCFLLGGTGADISFDGLELVGPYATAVYHAAPSSPLPSQTHTGIAGAGTASSPIRRLKLTGVRIRNFGYDGLFLELIEDSTFYDVDVDRVGRDGMLFYSLRHSSVTDCHVSDVAPGLVGVPPYRNVWGFHFTRRPQTPVAGQSSIHVYPPSEHVSVTGCHARNVWTWMGFDTHGGRHIRFSNCHATGCYCGFAISEADTVGLDGDCPARHIGILGGSASSKGCGSYVILTGATGGTWTATVTIAGTAATTTSLSNTVTASQLGTAIEALSNVTSASVSGTGAKADPFIIRVRDTSPDEDVVITTTNSLTGGGTIEAQRLIGPAVHVGSAPGNDAEEATPATLTTALAGANNDLVFTARRAGPRGNSIGVTYNVAGLNTGLTVPSNAKAFTVSKDTDVFDTTVAHGYVDGNAVTPSGAGLPAEIVAGRIYYIRDADPTRFRLAVAPGDEPIDITTDGSGSIAPVDVIVNVATNGAGAPTSTATQVAAAIAASSTANALVSVANAAGNDGTGVVAAMAETDLAGGSGIGGAGLSIQGMTIQAMGSITNTGSASGGAIRVSYFVNLTIGGNELIDCYRNAVTLRNVIYGAAVSANTVRNLQPDTAGTCVAIHVESPTVNLSSTANTFQCTRGAMTCYQMGDSQTGFEVNVDANETFFEGANGTLTKYAMSAQGRVEAGCFTQGRIWARISQNSGGATLNAHTGIASVTRTAQGVTRVVLESIEAFADPSTMVPFVTPRSASGAFPTVNPVSETEMDVYMWDKDGLATDRNFHLAIFGR
jgi:hypothetical protein